MNFSTSKRLLTLGASLVALSLGSVAQAQDKNVMIKMSSWVPAQHALNPALQAWGESLKKASGGSLNTTLFPSEQLGKAFAAVAAHSMFLAQP